MARIQISVNKKNKSFLLNNSSVKLLYIHISILDVYAPEECHLCVSYGFLLSFSSVNFFAVRLFVTLTRARAFPQKLFEPFERTRTGYPSSGSPKKRRGVELTERVASSPKLRKASKFSDDETNVPGL